MTDEINELTALKEQICSPEQSINVHSLELLIEISSNLIHDESIRGKVVGFLGSLLSDEKKT
jgi:hypothetical protein